MTDELTDPKKREFLERSVVVLSGVVAGGSAMARGDTPPAGRRP